GFGYPKIVKEHMGYNTLNPAFETRFQALGECKKQCKSRIAIGKCGFRVFVLLWLNFRHHFAKARIAEASLIR
ncbi:MAG: hypothetical protein J5I98_34930, partial [Phaeodactylibacter sp.]|nr:hypothetical protein [Phaeodactylibacter sp.]